MRETVAQVQQHIEHANQDVDIEEHQNPDHQILSFILADEEYGVDILKVQEIKGWEHTTSIPTAPDYVMGVINLRGSIVPVIDLRVRFGFTNICYDESTVVIILKYLDQPLMSEKIIGIVVDGVADVYSVNNDQLQDSPNMQGTIQSDFVQGLATVEEKMLIVLNIDQMISQGVLDDIKKRLFHS